MFGEKKRPRLGQHPSQVEHPSVMVDTPPCDGPSHALHPHHISLWRKNGSSWHDRRWPMGNQNFVLDMLPYFRNHRNMKCTSKFYSSQVARYADMFSAMGTEARLRTGSAAPDRASPGSGRQRDPGRVGYSGPYAFASSRQIESRGVGQGAAREHVSALHRKHRSSSGTTAFPVRRVLHAQQSRFHRRDHLL